MKQVKNVKQINEEDTMAKDSIFNEETIKCLLKSEEDIENNRTRGAREVIEELRSKYGF